MSSEKRDKSVAGDISDTNDDHEPLPVTHWGCPQDQERDRQQQQVINAPTDCTAVSPSNVVTPHRHQGLVLDTGHHESPSWSPIRIDLGGRSLTRQPSQEISEGPGVPLHQQQPFPFPPATRTSHPQLSRDEHSYLRSQYATSYTRGYPSQQQGQPQHQPQHQPQQPSIYGTSSPPPHTGVATEEKAKSYYIYGTSSSSSAAPANAMSFESHHSASTTSESPGQSPSSSAALYHAQGHQPYHSSHASYPMSYRRAYPSYYQQLSASPQQQEYKPQFQPPHQTTSEYSPAARYVYSLTDKDVLCGRGGRAISHPGNVSYRRLVQQYQEQYLRVRKKEKPSVVAHIVDLVRQRGGRFLQRVKGASGVWTEVDDVRAREKTSQALREGAPEIRQRIEEGKEEQGDSEGESIKKVDSEEEDKKCSAATMGKSDKQERGQEEAADLSQGKGTETPTETENKTKTVDDETPQEEKAIDTNNAPDEEAAHSATHDEDTEVASNRFCQCDSADNNEESSPTTETVRPARSLTRRTTEHITLIDLTPRERWIYLREYDPPHPDLRSGTHEQSRSVRPRREQTSEEAQREQQIDEEAPTDENKED